MATISALDRGRFGGLSVKIELGRAQQGLQWFFSFYLVFLVESEEGAKDGPFFLLGRAVPPFASNRPQQELIRVF